MVYRRRFKQLRGKAYEKHSGTKVHVIGPGTVITPNHLIRDTEVGGRDPAGGNDTIQLGRGYAEECNIGDIVKFVNIHIQAGPQVITDLIATGWIEWAFCIHKKSDVDPTNTNLGTQTLGDVCTKYFRNECIMTGNLPVSSQSGTSQEIQLKIPKSRQMLRTGDEWTLYMYARTVSTVETGTNTFKVYSSFNYKNYH